MSHPNLTRSIRLLIGVFALAFVAEAQGAGDTDLFTVAVPPNVMLLVDNSGSMNNLVWHPAFDPTATPTCATWDNSLTYIFNTTLTITTCGNTRTLYADAAIADWTRIQGRYLNWFFSDESDPYVADLASTTNGTRSACLVAEGLPPTFGKYRRSRTSAAREVLRTVICEVNAAGSVRFGLAKFHVPGADDDPDGGYVTVPIDDYTPQHGADLDAAIEAIEGESWTPLAETLYNVYRYFQSRSNPALGVDSNAFPVYDMDKNGIITADSNAIPGSPVQFACQKNFIIVITDGEPTNDDFTNMSPPTFMGLVGDFNPDNASPENGNEEPGSACPFCFNTTFYLDDLAMFMRGNDFQLDFGGDQVIDTYTVGFTTAAPANALLQKTAQVGNGIFKQSNNAEELATAIVNQILDILDKTRAFAAATVPASRTTDGDNFYASFFLPKDDSPFWQGHLKDFDFSPQGEILTNTGTCAVGTDLSAVPPCPTNAPLRTTATPFWDAADEVPVPGSRNLSVGFGGTGFGAAAAPWSTAGVAEDDLLLDLVAADPGGFLALQGSPYLVSDPSSAGEREAAADAIVSSIAGCDYGTLLGSDCTMRTNDDGSKNLLMDIFHSNPVVVGSPNAAVNDASYHGFALTFRQRDRVIYAGANDGFLHGFHAGDWNSSLTPPRHDRGTGTETMAFMPSYVRERIWQLPSEPGTRDLVTTDASPMVADVWLYRDVVSGSLAAPLDPPVSSAKQMEQWRTVLIGGLREGGQSYYALDVTDPSGSTYAYPGYLWEFPCDDCGNSINEATAPEKVWMGFTWSDAVITKVRVAVDGDTTPGGHERWVAIFGAGYHKWGDPNNVAYLEPSDPDPYLADPTARIRQIYDGDLDRNQGRAVFMVDITTGRVLAEKKYLTGPVTCGGATPPAQCSMKYAFASQPAVFDLDFDGFADVVYIGDLGGQIFKWVIGAVGDDPINNTSSDNDVDQPDWPFRRFFEADHSSSPAAPSYGTTHFQSFFFPPTGVLRGAALVLALGAGERADLQSGVIDGLDVNNDHFYVIQDKDPRDHALPVAPTRHESDLVDNAGLDSGTYTCAEIGENGFYITARDREKFITNSTILFGEVFTGSYTPPPPGADPCSASGTSFLYRFGLDCGEPAYPSNPGGGNNGRRIALGGGIPTRPRVSVGGLNQGGASGGCDSKVVVITSDGQINNDCPGSPPSSGVELRSWRER